MESPASSSTASETKVPLPQFLKIMTNGGVPVPKAIASASKIYKSYGSPSQLMFLTDFNLKSAGIGDAGDRKLILSAFRKAGYGSPQRATVKRKKPEEGDDSITKSSRSPVEAGPSRSPATPPITSTKRRRTVTTKNELLPDDPLLERIDDSALAFNEVLDEIVLTTKHTVVNRAPVMAAWATVVAERLNFKRAEALSIASVYTEMNAISKGISLGIYDKKQSTGMEASTSGAQPYVDLMGRRIPVYRTRDEQWRALTKGHPVSPLTAYGYISRSFRQNLPYVIGAMRLLAESFSPSELSEKAWMLYTQFRPVVEQWGKRSELSCSKILSLRKKLQKEEEGVGQDALRQEVAEPEVVNAGGDPQSGSQGESKPRMTLEEYEAALDEDHTFDDVNLDFSDKVTS